MERLVVKGAGKRSWMFSMVAAAALLAGCGGGGEDAMSSASEAGQAAKSTALAAKKAPAKKRATQSALPSRAEAVRFLNQATFGATEADIARVSAIGYDAWIEEQFAKPFDGGYYYNRYKSEDDATKSSGSGVRAGSDTIFSSFYTRAIAGNDQLRQRVAFALSEIFVVSTAGVSGDVVASVASYMDMLNRNAFGSYRTLLQDVSMHPAMGYYLSHLKNRKEDLRTGRVPDQNFAREIMQLFSIGLVQLNLDGTAKTDSNGVPLETYTQDDVIGLSRVFTGFSWGGADTSDPRFFGRMDLRDPNLYNLPMQGYPQYHSTMEKKFLGATIPVQAVADPAGSLRVALDTISAHTNVPPFISRLLIQRLATSSPSADYVRRVAAVFKDNGSGVRGDLKAVVKAILLDPEARNAASAANDAFGKLKEPTLRLTAFLRAYKATSDSGLYLISNTDDPGLQLGQTPLRSPSVFNFFRAGFVPPGTLSGDAGLTVPEMQITNEASVAGYVNFMQGIVDRNAAGMKGPDNKGTVQDIHFNFDDELAVAGDANALVDKVTAKLVGDQVAAELKSQILEGVNSIVIPAPKPDGRNQSWIDTLKRRRVNLAVLMTLASHEYIVQR